MRGPIDNLTEFPDAGASNQATESTPGAFEKPAGGKVLQRLKLFAAERSLPLWHQNGTAPAEAGRALEGTALEAAAPPAAETAAEALVTGYAEALLQTATDLKAAESRQPAGALEAAIAPAPPGGTGPQWRFLGPTMMTNGQTYGESRVVVSGRVSALALDPANSNHILCGAAGGGLWESRDRGASWAPRTDYMPTLTVGAIAFNPATPSMVYCGTGEGNFYWWLGAGLLRSTDGGTTWAVHAAAPFVGKGFYDLVVDTANASHLLAATTHGIYDSANGGTTWTQRRGVLCWDLAMAPAGGAAAEVLAACSDGLFRSVNGGAAFTRVTLPGGPASFDRLAVDIARSNPTVAYAFGAAGETVYLYQRTAAGTWQRLSAPPGLTTAQAWYDWFLAVAPDNEGQIYLGGIEAYRGTLSGSTWTWVTISNKTGDDIHPDQHAIAFDPANPNVVYVGNDGGLFASPNRGTGWTSLNNGLGITEIEYLAHDPGSSRWLLAGTQDNGSIRYTGSAAWDHIADGDGGDCGVNHTSPQVVFHTYYGMGVERSVTRGDFGSFTWLGPQPHGYEALFYPPLEVNNDTVAMAGQSVFISRNQGTAFTEVTFPPGGVASSLYIPNPDTVFIGTTDGRLFHTSWSGSAWSAATALTSPRTGAYLSDIFVDPGNLNRVWVTSTSLNGSRVFRSDNGGTSWLDRTAGLPNLPISAIAVHPGNANRVWVAADVGVYQSLDGGQTWTAFANGLPNALAVDLLYQPHARVLRVGLRNRGVWEIPVDGWLDKPVCGLQWTGALNPNQTKRWFSFNWPATWHMVWTVMPTNPIPGAPQVSWKVEVERASAEYLTYWVTVTNLTNQAVNFEGRYAILSYY
jgi:hypothetical protein